MSSVWTSPDGAAAAALPANTGRPPAAAAATGAASPAATADGAAPTGTATPVSSSSIALKNWPAIRFATPVIIRWPTPATGPPMTASAEYVRLVCPSPADSRLIVTVARAFPGAPAPDACMTYDEGRRWSVSLTSPAYVPRIAPTPTETFILYSSSPTCSRLRHPGIVRASTAGSVITDHTRSGSACSTADPSRFTPSLLFQRGAQPPRFVPSRGPASGRTAR